MARWQRAWSVQHPCWDAFFARLGDGVGEYFFAPPMDASDIGVEFGLFGPEVT